MMNREFATAFALASCLVMLGSGNAVAKHSKPNHRARPEHHVETISRHVPITLASGQGSRADVFLKKLGQHSGISAEARELKTGQTFTLLVDTAPKCGPGPIQSVGSLSASAARVHATVPTPLSGIRSLSVKSSTGQVIGCETVRRHKSR